MPPPWGRLGAVRTAEAMAGTLTIVVESGDSSQQAELSWPRGAAQSEWMDK